MAELPPGLTTKTKNSVSIMVTNQKKMEAWCAHAGLVFVGLDEMITPAGLGPPRDAGGNWTFPNAASELIRPRLSAHLRHWIENEAPNVIFFGTLGQFGPVDGAGPRTGRNIVFALAANTARYLEVFPHRVDHGPVTDELRYQVKKAVELSFILENMAEKRAEMNDSPWYESTYRAPIEGFLRGLSSMNLTPPLQLNELYLKLPRPAGSNRAYPEVTKPDVSFLGSILATSVESALEVENNRAEILAQATIIQRAVPDDIQNVYFQVLSIEFKRLDKDFKGGSRQAAIAMASSLCQFKTLGLTGRDWPVYSLLVAATKTSTTADLFTGWNDEVEDLSRMNIVMLQRVMGAENGPGADEDEVEDGNGNGGGQIASAHFDLTSAFDVLRLARVLEALKLYSDQVSAEVQARGANGENFITNLHVWHNPIE